MTDGYYTERLVRLPRSFFCYQPPDLLAEVNALPAATRLCHIRFAESAVQDSPRGMGGLVQNSGGGTPIRGCWCWGSAGSQFEAQCREIVAAAGR